MDVDKEKENEKKGIISKTWERCKTFRGTKRSFVSKRAPVKSRSWPRVESKKERALNIAPKGCFSVYVGPERQRFVIRAEHANHPRFQVFLTEAEYEYGYRKEGPIELPCEVEDFVKALLEMDDCYKVVSSQ